MPCVFNQLFGDLLQHRQVIQHEKGTTPSTQGEGAVEAADNEPGEDPFRDNEEVERPGCPERLMGGGRPGP